MSVALVQHGGVAEASGTNPSTSLGSTPTVDNYLIAVIATNGLTPTLALTNNAGQSWTNVYQQNNVGGTNRNSVAVFITKVGASPSRTVSGTVSPSQMTTLIVAEFSGITDGSFDVASSSASTGINQKDSGSVTTTNADDLLIGCSWVTESSFARTWTEPSGWAEVTNIAVASRVALDFAWQEVSSTGSYSYPGSTLSANSNIGSLVIAFKVGGGPTTYTTTLTATQAQSAALANLVGWIRSLTQAQAATLAVQLAFLRSLTATQAQSVVKKLFGRLFPGLPAIAQGQSATVDAHIPLFQKVLSATQASSAVIARAVSVVKSLTQPQAATLKRYVSSTRSATQPSTATLSLIKVKLLTLTTSGQAQVAKIVRQASKILKPTQAQSATAGRAGARTLSALQASSPKAVRAISETKSATQGQTATVVTVRIHLLSLITSGQAQVASLVRQAGRVLKLTQAQSAVKALFASKSLPSSQAQTATLDAHLPAIQKALSATQSQTAKIARAAFAVRAATQAQTASFKRSVTKTLALTQAQSVVKKLFGRLFPGLPAIAQGQSATVTPHQAAVLTLTIAVSAVTRAMMWFHRGVKIVAAAVTSLGSGSSAATTALGSPAAASPGSVAPSAAAPTSVTAVSATPTTLTIVPDEYA